MIGRRAVPPWAISNPAAEFQYKIEKFQVGDKITQNGNGNVGNLAL